MAIFSLSGSLTYSAEDYFLLCFGFWKKVVAGIQLTDIKFLTLFFGENRVFFPHQSQFGSHLNSSGTVIEESEALRSVNINGVSPSLLCLIFKKSNLSQIKRILAAFFLCQCHFYQFLLQV